MNKRPIYRAFKYRSVETPTVALMSLIVLTVVALLCYLPLLLNHGAHSMAVLHPEGSESIHMYAAWDASWNDQVPAKLDLRSQAEKDYDTVSAASSLVGGFDGPNMEKFSPAALQLSEACPWFGKEEVRELADKWITVCTCASALGLLSALFAGIFLDYLRHSPVSFPAGSALWLAGLVFSIIYIGNSLVGFAGWSVILPHQAVLLSSAILVVFLITSVIRFHRILRA